MSTATSTINQLGVEKSSPSLSWGSTALKQCSQKVEALLKKTGFFVQAAGAANLYVLLLKKSERFKSLWALGVLTDLHDCLKQITTGATFIVDVDRLTRWVEGDYKNVSAYTKMMLGVGLSKRASAVTLIFLKGGHSPFLLPVKIFSNVVSLITTCCKSAERVSKNESFLILVNALLGVVTAVLALTLLFVCSHLLGLVLLILSAVNVTLSLLGY
jgi:hypothetical protein